MEEMSSNTIQNIPPVVGEYSYFDSRIQESSIQSIQSIQSPHWIVVTEEKGNIFSHYSSPEKKTNMNYITCGGKITKIEKKI